MVYKTGFALLFTFQILFSPLAYSQQVKSSPVGGTPKNLHAEPEKNPNILFEGYSKILTGGVHAGYAVLRYEFDPKKKHFTATYLVKTEELGGNVLESLKAVADQEMKPISYEYTTLIDKQQTKTIDAKFSKDMMNATIRQGKTEKKVVEKIPKGTFLAIFLYYVILRSPSGLKTDTKYKYKAVAEEDAKVFDGVTIIGKEEKFNGIRAFKAANTFKDVKYTFYLTDTGEALMSETPAVNIKTILVAKPSEATANFKIPTAILTSLFGEVPMGTANTVSRTLQGEALRQNQPTPTKQYGVQGDSRIMMKDEAPKAKDKGE
jgi:hypothetical protein